MEIIDELKEKTEQQGDETPAADFGMGLLLVVLSATVCTASWFWPRPEGIASAPGLFPFLIAGSLLLMALALLGNALRLGGHRLLWRALSAARLRAAWAEGPLKLVLLTLATVLVYLVVVLNLLPFEVGTFLYMAVSLHLFWRGPLVRILLLSAAMVAFYSVSFKLLFRLVLPGTGM